MTDQVHDRENAPGRARVIRTAGFEPGKGQGFSEDIA